MFETLIDKIDNKLRNSKEKTEAQSKTEKRLKQEKLLSDIETELFPYWLNKSKISIQMDRHYECWRELLLFLYHSKALNKNEIYKQINYVRENKNV